MKPSYMLLLLALMTLHQADAVPILEPTDKVNAVVKSDPSPTLLQWASQFWTSYQQASSVLTPLGNDTWLASSILDTYVGTCTQLEEEEGEGSLQALSRAKRFFFLIPAIVPPLVAAFTGFATRLFQPLLPGKSLTTDDLQDRILNFTSQEQLEVILEPVPLEERENTNDSLSRQKRMVSLLIPRKLVDRMNELLTAPLLGNQTLIYPILNQTQGSASTTGNPTQGNTTVARTLRRITRSPDWNPVDIVFAIIGIIVLVGTLVGAISLAAMEHCHHLLLRQKSDSTLHLIPDDDHSFDFTNESIKERDLESVSFPTTKIEKTSFRH